MDSWSDSDHFSRFHDSAGLKGVLTCGVVKIENYVEHTGSCFSLGT